MIISYILEEVGTLSFMQKFRTLFSQGCNFIWFVVWYLGYLTTWLCDSYKFKKKVFDVLNGFFHLY